MEWPFLEQVLIGLSFPQKFITWLMVCVRTVSYSINLNGTPLPPFKARKGVRERDPMSSFLFVIVIEYLNRLLKSLSQMNGFKHHPRCAKLGIIQISFVDDLLLFSKGDITSVSLLFDCFKKFSEASGLIANLSKSSIYFGGVPAGIQHKILPSSGFFSWQATIQVPRSTTLFSTIFSCAMSALMDRILGRITTWSTVSFIHRESATN